MYSWGYIKNATLNKLDLKEEEAQQMNLTNRFVYYANEAITQISSAVKPKRTFAKIEVTNENVGTLIAMPNDFISFGHDNNWLCTMTLVNDRMVQKADSECFEYMGYNQILPKVTGIFYISYNARWITFDVGDVNDGKQLDVPDDILDCLPSYIASQCMIIDDEYKASVLRNEYEMMLARIDDTDYSDNGNFFVEGDW